MLNIHFWNIEFKIGGCLGSMTNKCDVTKDWGLVSSGRERKSGLRLDSENIWVELICLIEWKILDF